jgi:hypothetical protein
VTRGVYALLLKNGLHYKPTNDEVKNILTAAAGENASEADVELNTQNSHACVRARARAHAACPLSRTNCVQIWW